jgi:monoamine oxidase
VLEAGDRVGGRMRTLRTVSGAYVDIGAHWIHNVVGGSENPIRALLNRFDIKYFVDMVQNLNSYTLDGKSHGNAWRNDDGLNHEVLKRIVAGQARDRSLLDLVNPESSWKFARYLPTWYGVDPHTPVSAREYGIDKSLPGGLVLENGVQELAERIADVIGRESIRLNTAVGTIAETSNGVRITTNDGQRFTAGRVIFTGSLKILKSGEVAFSPPFSRSVQKSINRLDLGTLTKIVLELSPNFFRERADLEHLHIDLIGPPSAFANIHEPLITLLIGGEEGQRVEKMSPREARAYFDEQLRPAKEILGYHKYVTGDPLVSGWLHEPYMGGSYSFCSPGGKRSGPVRNGHIMLAGEAFDIWFPGTVTGAYLSGTAAGIDLANEL